jgi:ribosomal protein S2
MSSDRKHEKTIHSEARELGVNVIKACDTEANQKNIQSFGPCYREGIPIYGVSTATIKRIRQESKNRSDTGSSSTLYTPGKHRPRPNETNVNVDDFNMAVIRRNVHDF